MSGVRWTAGSGTASTSLPAPSATEDGYRGDRQVPLDGGDVLAVWLRAASDVDAGQRPPSLPKLLLTTKEVGQLLGLGRTKVYELLATNELPSVQVGGSRRITLPALVGFVRQIQDEQHPASRTARR